MASVAGVNLSDFSGTAEDVMASAMEGLANGARTQKNAGADAVAGFARAVRGTADTLQDQSPHVADLVRVAADTVERVSQDVKTKDIGEVLDMTTDFARQRPYLFLGLGVVAGALLARAMTTRR